MKRLSHALAALALLTLGGALATDIRIYPSFTEVRQSVSATDSTLTVALPQEAWNGVIPGSLDLEGLNFTQAIQKLEPNWLATLEGQTVYLKSQGGQVESVTLVRARDLMVKDAAGRYFSARFEDLQFDVLPPSNPLAPSRTLVYALSAPGSGTLSYLTRSVSWQARYTLKASDAGANLSALADIRNDADLPYDVKNSELYAGDVNIQGGNYGGALERTYSVQAMPAAAPAPKIQSDGNLRGLYKYTLDQPFTLPANSVTTLPFLTPKLTLFERYASLDTYFTAQSQEGNLNRAYRFKADQRLPAGQITVREEGRIVGQTNLEDTRQGGEVEFTLGDDPDVHYSRNAQLLTQVKNADGNVTKSTYKVTYNLENARSNTVRAEITEHIGGRRVIIDNQPASDNQGEVRLKVDLPAGAKVSKSFTVVIDNS